MFVTGAVYSVTTTTDGTPVEAVRYATVSGQLDLSGYSRPDTEGKRLLKFYNLFPQEWCPAIVSSDKYVDSNSNIYYVEHVELFDDHQELILRMAEA